MKKKILTAVLSMVLCLGMSVSVMAAPSAEAGDGSGAIKLPDGSTVEVEYTEDFTANANEAQLGALETMANELNTAEDGGTKYLTDLFKNVSGMAISNVDPDIQNIIDLKAPDGTVITKETPVVFSAPGVKKGDTVVVLHMKEDGTWENITATVEQDGFITGLGFSSLSPILWAKVTLEAAAPADNGYQPGTYDKYLNNAANTNNAATSPKTADAAPVLPVLALVCLAGVAVCTKKVKFN